MPRIGEIRPPICYKGVVSRKYKQRGYQEDGEGSGRGLQRGPRERRDGPRGRGLGAPTETSSRCARCGARIAGEVERDSSCRSCQSDLHTCTNCRFFDVSARNECLEPIEIRVDAKSKGNSCERFAVKVVKGFAEDARAKSDDPKAAFDALFDL
jgi:hypothetical protein